MTKALILIGIAIFTILYACCMVSHTSDEQAERMYQEYMKWKELQKTDDERNRR